MHGLAGPLLIEISSKVIDGHLTSWPESDGNGFLFSSLSIKPLEIAKNAISYITNARLPNRMSTWDGFGQSPGILITRNEQIWHISLDKQVE